MTTLVAFSSVNSEEVAAVYLASDSRISWPGVGGKLFSWDYGKKVFYSKRSPLMMGYCGDVVFPSQILSQIIDLIDNNLLKIENLSPQNVFTTISNIIKQSFNKCPKEVITSSFTIVICGRENTGDFYCFELAWNKEKDKWSDKPLNIQKNYSAVIEKYGSGVENFKEFESRYIGSDFDRTTRGIFNCFFEAIKNGNDPRSGGLPQLVGIYKGTSGQCFGIISDGKRYLNGMEIPNNLNFGNIEWRNELFEVCDGYTLKRRDKAQRHIKPNNIKK